MQTTHDTMEQISRSSKDIISFLRARRKKEDLIMKRTNTARWVEAKKCWRIDVQVDGLRRSFYSSTPGRAGQREANAKADAWIDAGAASTRQGLRCDAYLDEYLEHVRLTTSRVNYDSVRSKIKLYIRPQLGRIRAEDLTEAHLQRVLDLAAQAEGREHETLAKKTLQTIRAVLVQFCKYLRKAGVSKLHPEDLTISRKAPMGARDILQPQDLQLLFSRNETTRKGKAVPDPYVHAYRFAVLTGLRPGELLGLRWTDIVGGSLRISRAINGSGETTTGKNDNARRTFCLSDQALEELRQQRQISEGPSVFGIPSQGCFRESWYRYCEHNGIRHVTPYELRHTFVSIVQSLPEGELKTLVGHSASMDTFGVYAHDFQGQQERVAGHVDTIFREVLAAAK